MKNTCENCKHFDEISLLEHQQIGEKVALCLRYPPQMHPVQQGSQMGFMGTRPQVKAKDTCGEFAPSESPIQLQ